MSQDHTSARVAVVDDDAATRMLLGELLVDEGFDVVVWDGEVDPLSFARVARPSVVIVDLHLGQGVHDDSAPLHEQLANDPRIDAAIILCSADAIYLRDHAAELETNDVIVVEKPFNLDDLVDAVRHAASRVVRAGGKSLSQSALS